MFLKSDYFILSAAMVSLVASITLWILGHHRLSLLVGLWVPSILGFGNYLKIKSISS
ncbi:MAG: hypothetical protein R3211_11740 [Balneolaceae bacterium]|nr:hypothetical protein [Balneolaceae bacterium]